ncbi:MAG: helix-turn-helix transcriptional regulator [Firmicutes bacterium]|nr:helix-turn-helix transcriptional regulator [Bacillota bacterium]
MVYSSLEEMPACPVATTVQMIGSKWKLLIMRNLLARPWRFNELKKNLEGISQKVLTDSLHSMENDGMITRTVYPMREGAHRWLCPAPERH